MRVSIGLLVACVFAGCNVAPTPAGTASHLTPPAEAARPVAVADARPAVESPAADAARAAATADSAPPAPAPAVAPVEVRYREITIPAGTSLSLALTSGVSSKTSSVEDAVGATLRRAIVVDGVTVVPAGAAVGGHVTEAERSGKVKGRARIGMRFTSLRANGERYDIRTASIAREARGTKKKDAVKIGVGAGAGAIVGAIAGGKKGAAIGSAVGGGAGTGVVLATRGEEVGLGPGAVVSTSLTAPMTVRVRVP